MKHISLTALAGMLLLSTGCAPTVAGPSPTAIAKPAPTPTGAPAPTVAAAKEAAQEATMEITWLGQSTFVVTAGPSFKALLDPAGSSTGYTPATVPGVDVITMSHEHSDHNFAGLAEGSPLVLRGLAGGDWARIDQVVKGVRIRSVGVYHDDTQGSQRGRNAVFIFEAAGLRVAHMGDLGHVLSEAQVKDIGRVDIALIPVGGFYTVDAGAALQVVRQLEPRLVIPMHFRTPSLSSSLAGRLAPVDDFTTAATARGWTIKQADTLRVSAATLPTARTVTVLAYR